MSKQIRRHTDLKIVFKSGAVVDVHSDVGFSVQGSRVIDAEGTSVIPFLDPAAVAMIHSLTPHRPADAGNVCPVPTCYDIIEGPWYACREHWYSLPMNVRELVSVAARTHESRPDPTTQRRLEAARAKALEWWAKHPAETEGVAS